MEVTWFIPLVSLHLWNFGSSSSRLVSTADLTIPCGLGVGSWGRGVWGGGGRVNELLNGNKNKTSLLRIVKPRVSAQLQNFVDTLSTLNSFGRITHVPYPN